MPSHFGKSVVSTRPNGPARVFLSCGQRDQRGETSIAQKIAKELQPEFQTYIAKGERTLEGLKENIFRRLAMSDYFLFVDFRREQLANLDVCRGSVFCQQELALASFLRLPALGFRQRGLEQLPGVMQAIQMNCEEFGGARGLPKQIRRRVTETWDPVQWNTLVVERDSSEFTTATPVGTASRCRFYHAVVRNAGPRLAQACAVYPTAIRRVPPGDLNVEGKFDPKLVEFKWGGTGYPLLPIPAGKGRDVDVICVAEDKPSVAHLMLNIDSGNFARSLEGPGDFEIESQVVSESFGTVNFGLTVSLGRKIEDVRVELRSSQSDPWLDGKES